MKTPTEIVELVDRLLEDHVYAEIAELLNERGFNPGGASRSGRQQAAFDAKRVAYLAHAYGLRSRRDRLRERGMLTKAELANRLGIHEHTLVRWAEHGIVKHHAYNGHAYLYEDPGSNPPTKHCSRWDPLADRAQAISAGSDDGASTRSDQTGGGVV